MRFEVIFTLKHRKNRKNPKKSEILKMFQIYEI